MSNEMKLFCKESAEQELINGPNPNYTISSRPCPDVVDMPILIDSPVKRVFHQSHIRIDKKY